MFTMYYDRNKGSEPEEDTPLSGALLIAHPGLLDPNFKRNVVLLSVHSKEEGAIGVVINRPLSKTMGEHKETFTGGVLSDVPLYYGGPVEEEKMILTAWKWKEDEGVFKLFFGITPEKAESMLLNDPDIDIRGFLGYSGWTGGQLEGELKSDAWIVGPIDGRAIRNKDGDELWKSILNKMNPTLGFLANEPDDLSNN